MYYDRQSFHRVFIVHQYCFICVVPGHKTDDESASVRFYKEPHDKDPEFVTLKFSDITTEPLYFRSCATIV